MLMNVISFLTTEDKATPFLVSRSMRHVKEQRYLCAYTAIVFLANQVVTHKYSNKINIYHNTRSTGLTPGIK